MSITYDPQAVIPLPRMKAAAAATVGQSLVSAFQGEKRLPENIAHAAELHRGAVEVLKRALISDLDPVVEQVHLEKSRAEAANWSGLHSLLEGLAGSSIKKKAGPATKLKDILFPNGLTFLRLQTLERWTESDGRLSQIRDLKLDAELNAVGAADFVAAIHETHKALGDAAGITSAMPVSAKSGVQMAFDRWKAAARCYLAQVIAHQALAAAMAKTDAETQAANALAQRLLAPIASVDSSLAPKPEEVPPASPAPSMGAPAATDAPKSTPGATA